MTHRDPSLAKAPTILDVAQLAGVSKSTVSNVIRDVAGVTSETRTNVKSAIQALGYRPNVLARQLVQQRTTMFGVVIGDLTNPFHAEMTKQIERHASARGYQTMFVSAESQGAKGLERLLDYRVAGIIFLSYSGVPAHVRYLVEGRVPAVFVTCSANWGDVVESNDEQGGEAATRHLIELGHRRIAHFTDPITADAADRARQAGYRRALAHAGLSPAVFHWTDVPDTVMRNRREVPLETILRGPKRITAIFSSNDFGAIKVLDGADRLGIAVPRDLSVIGFDDVMIAGLTRFNLTTMAQPQSTLAEITINTLAERIEGRLVGDRVRRVVDVGLVVRGSTSRLDG